MLESAAIELMVSKTKILSDMLCSEFNPCYEGFFGRLPKEYVFSPVWFWFWFTAAFVRLPIPKGLRKRQAIR